VEFYADESESDETKIKKVLTHPQVTKVINILKEYAQSDRCLLLIFNKSRIDVDDSDLEIQKN
jgi:hypothetical protein